MLPLAVAWLLSRTSLGYAMRMTGLNRDFAEAGGVPMRRTILITMALSGALCGLAGHAARARRDPPLRQRLGRRAGHGVDRADRRRCWPPSTPSLTAVSGFFLAALQTGGTGLQLRTNVPLQLVNVIQAVIILMVAVRLWLARQARLGRRRDERHPRLAA